MLHASASLAAAIFAIFAIFALTSHVPIPPIAHVDAAARWIGISRRP